MLNTQSNNLKELLNMFQASFYIQEELMYSPPSREHPYGHYKKEYHQILDEIKEEYKDISETLEGEMFRFSEIWSNDLFGIINNLIKEDYKEVTEETKSLYFNKNVKKYVNEYLEIN